jgi:hypothetical protein
MPSSSAATPAAESAASTPGHTRRARLLNLAHALDHLFLLIFATAVAAIAGTSACALGGPDALQRRRLR